MQLRNKELTREVTRVFTREKGMAGRDQIATILGHEGIPVAAGTVGDDHEQAGPAGGADAGLEEDHGR